MNRVVLSFLGGLSGALVPFLWLIYQAFSDRKTWWMKWLKREMNRHGDEYLVWALVCIVILATVGYFWGRHFDSLEEEAFKAEDSNIELSELASTDGLTGLLNNRAIHERLDIEIENAQRLALTCLIIDIDHFKKINDKHGHPFGDEVLVTVASILKDCVRRADAVGRLGGEEFLVILPGTPSQKATLVSERIRQTVEESEFFSGKKKVKVTVSLGLADNKAPGLNEKEALLKAADDALYQAKETGRNRTVIWKQS